MLKENGIDPVVIPPDVDESVPEGTVPHIAVMYLALKKALYVLDIAKDRGYTEKDILIGADTIVFYRNSIIGKPENSDETYRILKKLGGKRHQVLTGVAILTFPCGPKRVFYETSDVLFKTYSDEEIIKYAKTDEPYDKAGGYAVQGTWGKHIARITGDIDNVIGFPWTRIQKELIDLV